MAGSSFVRSFALALALCIGAAGCGLKTGREDSKKTEEAIKSELGIDARINFRTFTSTANGTRTIVTVSLGEPPVGDAREFKAKVSQIVERNFRSQVDRVEIAF